MYHQELAGEKVVDAVSIFSDNLRHSNNEIRLSTLRILCHYQPLGCVDSTNDQPAAKKMRTEVSQNSLVESQGINVCVYFLAVLVVCHYIILDDPGLIFLQMSGYSVAFVY